MALVCKKCGYKQYDDDTITIFKEMFPEKDEHDIVYYCGACIDNATEKEYDIMQFEMHGGTL